MPRIIREDEDNPSTPIIIGEQENPIDTKIELLRFASQVQSRIKNDISEDFVLAKLSDQDKEGIIEMTGNAYFSKRINQLIKKRGRKWQWNDNKKYWEERTLNEKEVQQITDNENATFDSYLNRIYMTVILNRNVPQNHLLQILSQAQEEQPPEEENQQNIITKILQPEQPNT